MGWGLPFVETGVSREEAADFLVDPVGLGDDAAKAAAKQKKEADKVLAAQQAESEAAREFLRQQATQGKSYISKATSDAKGALGDSREAALQALASGYGSAHDNLGTAQSRIAELMSGRATADWQSDPAYQMRIAQGADVIGRFAGKAGLSGDNLAALYGANQASAAAEAKNYENRQTQLGTQLAGIDTGMADVNAQFGTANAQREAGLGSQLAQLYAAGGLNKANIGIGAAAQNNALTGMINSASAYPVQFVGGDGAARAQGTTNAVNIVGGVLGACDIRFKHSIVPADQLIEEVLSVLTPYSYGYYDEKHGRGRFVGIMAQDAEKSQAGQWLVEDTADGKFIDIRKAMSLALAAAAHERKKRMELEERIAALEAKAGVQNV